MKLIVPCCGRSSRFPNLAPKWMLPADDGMPMICAAVSGLRFDADDLIVTLLREHEDRFGATAGLAAAFGRPIRTCILDRQTRSQAETVAETLRQLNVREPFLVKDSDGAFDLDALDSDVNYVCVESLNRHDLRNPRNKSYVQVDDGGSITMIREKKVISDLFNVGGYFFRSPEQFLRQYERLSAAPETAQQELYLSNIIAAMISDGVPFQAREVRDYHDWGTLDDWRRVHGARRTLFVALDGFVFQRGDPFFRPLFSEVSPNREVVAALKTLIAEGHTIVYLSIRAERWKQTTEQQLSALGMPTGPVVYDCPTAKWLLVGTPHAVAPFRSVETCEPDPDDPRLLEQLRRIIHTDS